MRRTANCLIGAGLAASLIVAGIGCSCNPMSSQDVIPIEQESNQDVVSSYTGPQDPGGHPMTPSTHIDKYESDEVSSRKAATL